MAQAKVAFLIVSNDPEKVLPGLVMARRLKENRGADVRVLFFGPAVKTAVSGPLDEAVQGLAEAGISPKACSALVDQFELNSRRARSSCLQPERKLRRGPHTDTRYSASESFRIQGYDLSA